MEAVELSQVKYTPGGSLIETASFIVVGSLTNMGAEVLAGQPEAWVRLCGGGPMIAVRGVRHWCAGSKSCM